MEIQKVSESTGHLVSDLAVLRVIRDVTRCAVYLLNQEGALKLSHLLDHLLSQVVFLVLGILMMLLFLGHLHPRVVPDLLQCGPLLVVVSHHIEHQVFKFVGVAVAR